MTWDVATVVSKFLILVTVAIDIGGISCFILFDQSKIINKKWLLRYLQLGSLIGIIATSLFFLVQIGAINQMGMSGMIDVQMGLILAQSGLGYASAFRLCGFFLILASVCLYLVNQDEAASTSKKVIINSVVFIGILLLTYSFSLTGHVANKSFLMGVAIGVHVLAMAFWVGSLYPLWKLCLVEAPNKLRHIMHRFGVMALFFVALLVMSGVFLITQLLESFSELVTTPYGMNLLIKLIGVSILLLLAARNKFRLVPLLAKKGMVVKLNQSIAGEIIVAFAIIFLTAYFTTLVGMGHS